MPEPTPTPRAALAQTSSPIPSAALAQSPALTLGLAQRLGSPTQSESAPRLVGQDSPLLASLPVVSTPETRGGPFGRVACGKCEQEFLISRPNLKCPRCGGSPDGASLERAFGTGREEKG